MTTKTIDIPAEHIAAFDRDGITVLRGAFSEDWIERLRTATEHGLANPTRAVRVTGDKHRFVHDRQLWRDDEDFRAFVFESPAATIAKAFMRASRVNFYFDHLLVKEPGSGAPTPWHQDQPYWPIQGRQICSIWVALDPVTRENGAVEYVKGSHRSGVWYQPESFGKGNALFGGDGAQPRFETMPDVDARRGEFDIACYDLAPGDCTIHHALIVHGAPGNTSSTTRRRGYSTRWIGDDARYDPRPNTDPELLADYLNAGDAFGGAMFPAVTR